jgi:hypothetical protein
LATVSPTYSGRVTAGFRIKNAVFFAYRQACVKKALFSMHITGDLAGNGAQVHQMFH